MDQSDLFNLVGVNDTLSLHGFGELDYFPEWLSRSNGDGHFARLHKELDWQQPQTTVYGKTRAIPRKQVWFGDSDAHMAYSGTLFPPADWHPLLREIKENIENQYHHRFNSVLVNLYRDGQDSVGWHADDEIELGQDPVIASVSLGAPRTFSLKPKSSKLANAKHETIHLPLHSGDLLIMRGKTQSFWQHAILKDKRVQGARINLTFRLIVNPINGSPRSRAGRSQG